MFDSKYSKIAYQIACKAHQGQIDKAGRPYIEHPVHVALQLKGDAAQAVALLHDVLEDSLEYSPERLMEEGIPVSIIQSLKLLCHKDDGLTYMEYVQKIKDSGDEIARAVKIEDLKHNMDLSRIESPSAQDYSRIKRYEKALKMLTE